MAVAELPFEFSEVKLAAPVVRPGSVAKEAAITQLRDADAPIVTVVAPAGYGKTTFLASWSEADPRPFAWVALDKGDDDATVFLRCVAAAIHRVEPLPPEVLVALSGPGGSTRTDRVPQLGSALAGLEGPIVLVLDDLHVVRNAACLDALVTLSEYVRAGSQIAIASREQPDLPLARWRASGLLHEIAVDDLRLDERESRLLLRSAGVDVDESALNDLAKRTEGWPAGLYLAALALRAGGPRRAEPAAVSGNDRFISGYFRLEMLSRLSEEEERFLKYSSVLDRMCGGLCDAVLEMRGSGRVLQDLERTNRFVVPLDERGEWYRYHHLFGELLRKELELSEPEVVAGLNSRAMGWCIANDLPEPAIAYGHAAGETDTVAGLVDKLTPPLYYDGRVETVDEWLDWFSDGELVRYPALAVERAWIRALTGHAEDAERLLALVDGATSTIPLSDGSTAIAPWVATLRAHMMPAGVEQALVDTELALSELPSGSVWVPAALLMRGVGRALLDPSGGATHDLEAAAGRALVVDAVEEVFLAHAQLALLAARRGAWTAAAEHAGAAQSVVDEAGLVNYPTSALAHVATARVALHQQRPDDARAALLCAHRLRPHLDHAIPWHSIQVGLELTRAYLALGESLPARTILADTARMLELRPNVGWLVTDAADLSQRLASTSGPGGTWAMSLTGAELRLLPYLATHLTFPEIGTRLFVSRHTVKSEAVAIYRKFGVSSRNEAIERAVEVGLLESTIYPPPANFIPGG